MMDLSKASLAILLAGLDAQAPPTVAPDAAAADAAHYVTADVERHDRMAAQRLALVGFLHVGV